MALDPVTELEVLVDALDADGVPYALCGDLALAVYGYPRATKDIDLLVHPTAVDAIGSRSSIPTPASFSRSTCWS